jgi:hypothetical protein
MNFDTVASSSDTLMMSISMPSRRPPCGVGEGGTDQTLDKNALR